MSMKKKNTTSPHYYHHTTRGLCCHITCRGQMPLLVRPPSYPMTISPVEVPLKSHQNPMGLHPEPWFFFVSGVVSTSSQAFRSGAATVAEEVDVQVFWQRGAGLRFWAWQLIYYYYYHYYYYHYYYYIVWLHND